MILLFLSRGRVYIAHRYIRESCGNCYSVLYVSGASVFITAVVLEIRAVDWFASYEQTCVCYLLTRACSSLLVAS